MANCTKNSKTGLNNIQALVQVLEALCPCAVSGNCDDNEVNGCITLNQGQHEITVHTDVAPTEVFLSVQAVGTPVCVGDINMVGSTLLPDGFILYADIKSNVAEVCYCLPA